MSLIVGPRKVHTIQAEVWLEQGFSEFSVAAAKQTGPVVDPWRTVQPHVFHQVKASKRSHDPVAVEPFCIGVFTLSIGDFLDARHSDHD
ncbi:hypothetical protein PSTT_15263 [Puccinia striiformis]|nr:hypothetical protein PSTT_15263 [Puccinia striiformis]